MKHSIVVKRTPVPNQYTTLYTVPVNVLYATVSINMVNLVNENAGVHIAITKTTIPLKTDFVDYKLPLESLGGQLCRQGFVLSAGESVVVLSDHPQTIFRLTGVVLSVDIPELLDYNYFPNDANARFKQFYMYNSISGVSFGVKAKNLSSALPPVQFSKNENFLTLENVKTTLVNYDTNSSTIDIKPVFLTTGLYYMRISNDGQAWSNTLSFDIVAPPVKTPTISALPNCDLVPDGVMLNSGPAAGVNAGFILTGYNYLYVAVDFGFLLTTVYVSSDINFSTNVSIISDYDINNPSHYYLKLEQGKTYYIKAVDIGESTEYVSNIFTLTACR